MANEDASNTLTTPVGLLGHDAVNDLGKVPPSTARTLLNVAAGATANATDAQLRDRVTHTGAQAINTITGLQTALNAKVDTVFGRGGVVVAVTNDYNADQIAETVTNKVMTATERTKLAGISAGATANATDAQLRDRSTHTGVQATSTITGLDTALAALAPKADPTLTGTVIVPTLPGITNDNRAATTAMVQAAMALVSGGTRYLGNWNASTNTPTLSNGSGIAVPGGFYVVSVAGSTAIDGINAWTVGDWIISDNVGWKKIDQTDAVSSVFGRTGTVIATSGDYTADQIAETASNKVMTAAERTKLTGISAGATVNATDAQLRDRATHTGAQAISTVTGLQTALNAKVDTVFGRSGAVVAATADYNADQIAETATNKILTAVERTKLAGIETAATADQTAVEIEAGYNAQVAIVTQAEAQAGALTTVRRWTPERVRQAALATGAGGVTGTPNSNSAAANVSVALGATEVQIGTITITPSSTNARIAVFANLEATKDTGTVARVMTIRVRRGTLNTDPLIGTEVITTSPPTASTGYNGSFAGGYDNPGVTTTLTYSVRALVGAGASTANRYNIHAMEAGSGGFDINGLPEDTAPDPLADFAIIRDVSTGTNKKTLLNKFTPNAVVGTPADPVVIRTLRAVTQAVYNGLTPDPNTIYFING